MSATGIRQFQYESESWKRTLAFMTDEMIHLKNRLSEVLRGKIDATRLITAENFQTCFITQDDLIALLKSDIADFDKLLVKEIYLDGAIIAHVKMKLKNIGMRMRTAEDRFNDMKMAFNNQLMEMTDDG